ncbi:hypothetical protein PENSPDRAFT_689319 [Peniophora sp. CONT]|nr:hypothetical protein PENSPDRAFT_689319 [Peniophora sp. CONT]
MVNDTSTPYYGPDEDTATIFQEHVFLASDIIAGFGYGIQLVLYMACVRYLWSQRHMRRHALFLLAYTTVVFCVQTVFVGAQALAVQRVYIDNRNYRGGPWVYFLSSETNIFTQATLIEVNLMSDALVLWRCWVIWQAAARGRWMACLVISVPFLMLIAFFATGMLWLLRSSRSILTISATLPRAYLLSYYAISLSFNIVLTLLIGRLLQYRASIMESLPSAHARHYLSIATVLFESAALYSVFAVCFLVAYAVNNGIALVLFDLAQVPQQISAYLII